MFHQNDTAHKPHDGNQRLAETRNRIVTMTPAELAWLALLLRDVTPKTDRNRYITQQLALLRLRALGREGQL